MAKNGPEFEISAVDKFSRVIREARSQLTGLKSSIGGLGSVAATVAGPLGALAGSLSLSGAIVGFKTLVDQIDDLSDRAQGLGITASALSDLQAAARTAGVGSEDLATALTRLNVRLTDAANGGKESQAIFKAMGISVRDSAGNLKSTEQVLGEVADKFQSYRDGAEKSALAVDLFGRAGAKLIAYLNAGASGLKEFSGLTEETARQAGELSREFDKMAVSLERTKNATLGWILPNLNPYIEAASELVARGRLAEVATKGVARALEEMRRELENERTTQFFNNAMNGRYMANQFMQNFGLDKPRAPGVPATTPGVAKPEQISASRSALAQYVEQLQRAQDALEGIGEVEKTLQFLKENPQVDTPQVRELLLNQAQIVDSLKEEAALRQAIGQATREQIDAERELRDSVLAAAGVFEEQRKIAQTNQLEKLIGEGLITPEQAERAVKAIAGVRDEVEKTKNVSDELGLMFSSAFEDAIVGAKSFKDILKGLADDLLRLFIRRQITQPLFDWLGSSMPSVFGGARAAGGPVWPGQAFLVGERGPELFTPGSSGRITPNNRLAGAAFNVTVNVDSRTDQAVIAASVRQGMRAAQAEIFESMRRGGAFA